ncbi:MAG: hypothetical protein U0271_22680 [Polyangiaceae bacterium]
MSSVTETLPSSASRTVTANRQITLADPTDPFSLLTRTETTTIGTRTWSTVYDASTRTETTASPTGRISVVSYDQEGRPILMESPDTLPVSLVYDGFGRVVSTAQGTRVTTRTYGADGLVASVTDPLNQTTSYTRDAIGRILTDSRPDSAVTETLWTADGQLAALTPPGAQEHAMTYNVFDLLASYQPPTIGSAGPTTYNYNLEKQLVIHHQLATASVLGQLSEILELRYFLQC